VKEMLDEILAEIRNYFIVNVHSGKFEVIGGNLSPLDFLKDGQYFKIHGSVFNDGFYRYPESGLVDETFSGEIWALAVPPTLIALVADIEDYEKKAKENVSPFESESFGGYSYTKATDGNGSPLTWKTVFAKKLNRWRKI
jgi:hypothetical protein